MTDLSNVDPESRAETLMASPDKIAKVRDLFGVDSDMEVPAFSEPDERVPDLDPTYVDAYGQPLLRMTFDIRENERKMSVYLSKKIDEIAKATGADIAPPTAPRK